MFHNKIGLLPHTFGAGAGGIQMLLKVLCSQNRLRKNMCKIIDSHYSNCVTKCYVYFKSERWALQTSALGRANVECSVSLAQCEHSRRQARRTRAREVVSSRWEGGKRTKLVPTVLAVDDDVVPK